MKQAQTNKRTGGAAAPTACTFTGELLTLAEAARFLKVSRKTIYGWKAQGKIRFVKVAGTLIRVTQNELERLINKEQPE